MLQDRIIGVLIGFAGACNNNIKTESTDKLLIEALAFPSSGLSEEDIIQKIRTEKDIVAPGCAVCASPCGNTSDYNMNRIYNAGQDICDIKHEMISFICNAATYVYINKSALTDDEMNLFYTALSYIGYDLDAEQMKELFGGLREKLIAFTEKRDD